jgi:hypothetical protein
MLRMCTCKDNLSFVLKSTDVTWFSLYIPKLRFVTPQNFTLFMFIVVRISNLVYVKIWWRFYVKLIQKWLGPVAQSISRLATGWTVRGSNPGGGEIFRTCPHRLWVPPSLLYNGYRVFPGGRKRPGHDVDPSPLSVPRSKIRVELYLYPP